MAAGPDDTTKTLNELIETCKDGEDGYRIAAEDASRADLKELFQTYSRQRAHFASELQGEVAKLGRQPESTGSMAAGLHRRWIDVKSAITGQDDASILAECARGDQAAVDNYREAVESGLSAGVKSLVESQYNAVVAAHSRVAQLAQQLG